MHLSSFLSRQREVLLAVCASLLLCGLVFWRVLAFDFVNLDDNSNLKKNPAMQDLALAWRKPYLDAYLPVVYTVWRGLHAVAQRGGAQAGKTMDTFSPIPELDPAPFHAANLLLHALNGALLFLLLRTLFPAQARTVLALCAALFLLHPLQVEAVAWVTALKDVLSGTFSLLLLWLYVQKPLSDYRGRQNMARMLLLAGVLLLACLAKSTRIFLPLFLLPLGALHWRKTWWRMAADLWPLFAVSALVMLIALAVQPPPQDMAYQALWQRPLVAADALVFYLGKLLWPAQLALDYGRNPRFLFESGAVWQFSAVPLVLAALWWWRRRQLSPWLQLGAAGFVLALLPLLGLQPFVFQTISTVSDRYCYLSIALLLFGIAPLLPVQRWPRAVPAVLVMLVLACGVHSWQQLPVWHNSYTLWQHTLRVTPDSGIAHNNLASIHEELGNTAEAIAHYEEAFPKLPRADLCSRIAILHTDLKQWRQALQWIDKGLLLAPDDAMLQHNRTVVLAQLQPRAFGPVAK